MILEVKHTYPRLATGIFFASIFSLILFGCSSESPEANLIDIKGEAQGTYYSIKYLSDSIILDKEDFDALFARIDSSLSTYKAYSLISRFNRADSIITEDHMFIEMIRQSQYVYHQSEAAFDPTVMPLVRAWGFGPEGNEFVADVSIDSLLNFVGWDKMEISDFGIGKIKIVKKNKGVQLDFNAIAQGYASDLIAELLDKNNIDNYLIDSGGELKAKGLNHKGTIWTLGIDKPEDGLEERQLIATFELNNKSVATSGNYRKFYVKDGIKYSHTISPFTGKPVEHSLLSATVITDTCSLADAYATALMVMGTDKAIEFIETHPNIEAYLVFSGKDGAFKSYQSSGLRGKIKENN